MRKYWTHRICNDDHNEEVFNFLENTSGVCIGMKSNVYLERVYCMLYFLPSIHFYMLLHSLLNPIKSFFLLMHSHIDMYIISNHNVLVTKE